MQNVGDVIAAFAFEEYLSLLLEAGPGGLVIGLLLLHLLLQLLALLATLHDFLSVFLGQRLQSLLKAPPMSEVLPPPPRVQ